MPEIAIAERAGVGADGHPRPTEDHVVVLDNAVLVLDGATSSDPAQPPGGWYAERLARRLAHDLRAAPEADHRAVGQHERVDAAFEPADGRDRARR